MPWVTVRVHEAGTQDGPGPPVGGLPVEVIKEFYDDPADFFFPPPAVLFAGQTAADGEVSFEAVAGLASVTPHLVIVRLPPGWRHAPEDRPPAPNPSWLRLAPDLSAVAAIEVVGRPDGSLERDGVLIEGGRISVAIDAPAERRPPFLPDGIPSAPELLPGPRPSVPPPPEPAPVERPARPATRRHLLAYAFVAAVVLAGAGGALKGLASGSSGPNRPAARPVTVIGTFTEGAGGCPNLSPTFSRQYALTREGESALLFQPGALDTVVGTALADGGLFLHNGLEEYRGTITGSSATGTYRVLDPRTRCTETYRFTFSLPAGPPPG